MEGGLRLISGHRLQSPAGHEVGPMFVQHCHPPSHPGQPFWLTCFSGTAAASESRDIPAKGRTLGAQDWCGNLVLVSLQSPAGRFASTEIPTLVLSLPVAWDKWVGTLRRMQDFQAHRGTTPNLSGLTWENRLGI